MSLSGWGIRERGGDPLDGGDVRAAMSPKEENRRGAWYGDKGEDRELTGCREKGKRTVHEYGGCGIMPWLHEDGVLMVPDTDGVHMACGNSYRHV